MQERLMSGDLGIKEPPTPEPETRPRAQLQKFPNGKQVIEFDEFINVIKDSCTDAVAAEDYLVLAFSMFDIDK